MKKVSRRDFMKFAAIGAAGSLAAASLQGCSPASGDKKPDAEATTQKRASTPTDGVYVTKSLGHESWIYVSTTIRDGAITACKVVRDNETIGIGNYACARIPAAILANQSINVPNVRGCSISSEAIKSAVKEAIELSGYDVANFSKEIGIVMTNEVIEETCDVVVVGAGTAGLMAASRLAEKGLKVIVVEKKDIPGGSMSMTYSGIITTGSRRQFAFDVNGSLKGTPNGDLEVKLASLAKTLPKDSKDVDLSFCRVLYGESGAMADWLSDVGVGFRTFGQFEGATSVGSGLSIAPGMYMGGVGYMMMFLADRISKFPNAKIIYSTAVSGLLHDEKGIYNGVKAVGNNGNTYTIHAKAVCLCAGGFARDAKRVAEIYPKHAGQFFNCASGSTGEVMKMGLEAGGVFDAFGGDHLPAYLSSKSLVELAFAGMTTPGLFVNTNGVDLGSAVSHANTAAQKLDSSNGDRFYLVFDETSAETTKKNLLLGFDTYNCLFERGEVVHYESVAACMEKLKLPELQAQIDENNEFALTGEADKFGRKNRPFIETRNGIYAVEVMPTFYLTTDGLRIDEATHLLNKDNKHIAGLYAAGDTAGSVEKKDGLVYAYGFDSAVVFGWKMAETVAAEI